MASTLLERGLQLAARTLPAIAGGEIVYQRGGDKVEVEATFGRSEFTVDDGLGGVRIEYSDRDFIMSAAALILGGTLGTPERGDRIDDLDGHIYEVLAPDGQQVYRACDPERRMFRIHAKRLS